MNISKFVKSIYDKHKEDRQNNRLAQDLNNHNWLVNKIITNQLETDLNKIINNELVLKENMKGAKECSEKSKTSMATEESFSQLDHSDGSQAQLKNSVLYRSMPDLGNPITLISDVKGAPKSKELPSSLHLFKKKLESEDINSECALSKSSSLDRTPVDQPKEGEASVAQCVEDPIAGKSEVKSEESKLFNKDTPKLIKHKLPVQTLPVRKTYRQRSVELATSVKTKEPPVQEKRTLLDSESKMDEERIIEYLLANNITTVAQLIQIIESYENIEQITDEERSILEFLKNKDISTLETLLENLRDEDIIFVSEEVLPDGMKIVPLSRQRENTLIALSNENKRLLHELSGHDWCRNMLTQRINNPSNQNIDNPSCSTQVENPITVTQDKEDASSIVDNKNEETKPQETLEDSTETPSVQTTQVIQEEPVTVIDAAAQTKTTTDACNQTLESYFCGERTPGPSTSTQTDEATVIASGKQQNNYPYTARDALPQAVQRTASIRERKRSYASRDPRSMARHHEQLMLHNAAVQQQISQPSSSNVPVPPRRSPQLPHNTQMLPLNSQIMPPNTRQLTPHASQIPRHYSQLLPNYAHQMTRTTHPRPHHYHEDNANRRPNASTYRQNRFNDSQNSMGQNTNIYDTDTHTCPYSANGGQRNQSFSYYQQLPPHLNISGQHWHESMITNQTINNTTTNQTITTRTGMNTRTNTTVTNHTITNPIMSLSAMDGTTNYAGQHHWHGATATAPQWTLQEEVHVSGENRQGHANAASQFRASMSNTRGQRLASNSERQFPNTSTDRVSPQIAATMPEWLWHARHLPKI